MAFVVLTRLLAALFVALGYGSVSSPPAPQLQASGGPSRVSGSVPQGFLAASVTFVSATKGWLLGSSRCTARPCTALLVTDDGGASWSRVPAPRAPLGWASNDPFAVDKVRFADARNGFAFSRGLWSTHDGAAHWQLLASVAGIHPYVLSDLVETPAGLYALVSGVEQQYGGSDGHYRVVVGDASGDSFRVLADLGPNSNAEALIAAGNDAYLIHGGSTLLHITRTAVAWSSLPDFPCASVAASSAPDLLLACGQGVAGGAMGSRQMYGSRDAGQHWTRLPDPGAGEGYDTEGLAVTANGHALLGTVNGGGSVLLATVDYARSWRQVLTFSDAAAGFGDLGYENALDGVVIYGPGFAGASQAGYQPAGSSPEGGVLYRTHDGGRTWRPATHP